MDDVTVQDVLSPHHHHHNNHNGNASSPSSAPAANNRGLPNSKKTLRPRMSCNQCRFRKVKVNIATPPFVSSSSHCNICGPTAW